MTATAERGIVYVPLGAVTRALSNPKDHALELVIGSIGRHGFTVPLLRDDRTGRLVAGHGRLDSLEAMLERDMPAPAGILERDGQWLVPVITGWSSVDDAHAESVLVGDNRLSELGGWNKAELAGMLDGLRERDLDLLAAAGYVPADVDALLAELAQADYDGRDPADVDDAVEPLPVVPISEVGDVWQLGRHRLVVGSGTDLAVVMEALAGRPCSGGFTDPPYGVSYSSAAGKIVNDDLKAQVLQDTILLPAFEVLHQVLLPGATFYICGPSGNLELQFRLALRDAGLRLRQQIVWVKDSLVLGRSDYHLQHETILYGWQLGGEPAVPPHFDPAHDTLLYGWKDGAAHTFEGGRKQTSVWQHPKPRRSDLHPTMKPIELVRRAVLNSTLPGVTVLDQFGGSGSTLMACEMSGRTAAIVELDPKYADVICRRFQKHSGLRPVRGGVQVDFSGPVEFEAPLATSKPAEAGSAG